MKDKKTHLDTMLKIFDESDEPIQLIQKDSVDIIILRETPQDDRRVKLFFNKKTGAYQDKTIE